MVELDTLNGQLIWYSDWFNTGSSAKIRGFVKYKEGPQKNIVKFTYSYLEHN